MSGFYSPDGFTWTRIGMPINALNLDVEQTQFNDFTGSQQGLYVKGKPAFFDLYIYRDAYTNIAAQHPANRSGVTPGTSYLTSINNGDWALYAGVEFGGITDYMKTPASFGVIASSENSGGTVEVWLDSIDTGTKITECEISNTGSWSDYQVFTSEMEAVTGRHDVYLKFTGDGTDQLFRLKWLKFLTEGDSISPVEELSSLKIPRDFNLMQNYPNPFNPVTTIKFEIPKKSFVSLKVYNLLGEEINELAGKEFFSGVHSVIFNASHLASGICFYTLRAKNFMQTRKMFIIR